MTRWSHKPYGDHVLAVGSSLSIHVRQRRNTLTQSRWVWRAVMSIMKATASPPQPYTARFEVHFRPFFKWPGFSRTSLHQRISMLIRGNPAKGYCG